MTRIVQADRTHADIDQDAAWSQMYNDVSHYVRALRDCSFYLAEMFDESASFDSFDVNSGF